MNQSYLTHQTVEHLFRHESGKMLSVLVKLFGLKQVGIAEDIVQDTLVSAFDTWKIKGMPENPRAWLYRDSDGPQKGIDALLKMKGLENNHLYHTALGDFFLKNKDNVAALQSYKIALSMANLTAEQRVITSKMAHISP